MATACFTARKTCNIGPEFDALRIAGRGQEHAYPAGISGAASIFPFGKYARPAYRSALDPAPDARTRW